MLALRRRGWSAPEARALAIFAWLGMGGLAAQYAVETGRLAGVTGNTLAHLPQYVFLLLSWAVLGFTLSYIRASNGSLRRWTAAVLPVAGLILLDSSTPILPEVHWRSPTQVLALSSVTWYAMDAVCAALLSYSAVLAIRSSIRARQPLHRNRLVYLLPVLGLIGAGAFLVFTGRVLPSLAALLPAALLMAYMTTMHQFFDLKHIARQALAYLILAVITFAVIAAGFTGASVLFAGQNGYTPVWFGAAIAALLAVVSSPLLTVIRGLVDRLLSGPAYRSTEVVSEYGRRASNILDLQRLAAVSVDFLRQTLRIDTAHLALVDPCGNGFRLTGVSIEGTPSLEPGSLAHNSPIAARLCQERRPLTQYDLDMLPAFQSAGAGEQAWFHTTGMDVYVPVISRDAWIGLLLLGSKRSRDRYTAEDLALLNALASQMAVSLENARLVSHLEALNRELKTAYGTLERAKGKLERLDKIKTDFISIASHELRTPLTLVAGYSEMLAAYPPPDSSPDFLQTLAGIQSGAARMHEIIASMLDVARIDSSTLDLTIAGVQIPALVKTVQSSMQEAFEERKIRFSLLAADDLPEIEADPNELHKVMAHLTSNALKYTPDGGCLEVTLRSLPAHDSPLGQPSIEMVYSDTGIGIDPATCDLIFTKFYQTGPVALHSSGKSKFKGGGPGLGLAIVRGIVEAHGGIVWAESEGCDEESCPGSRFHIVLPVRQANLALEDRPTIPLSRMNGQTG